jgi:hypothetical protein
VFCSTFIALTWAGAMPVEPPFEGSRKTLRTLYFLSVISL